MFNADERLRNRRFLQRVLLGGLTSVVISNAIRRTGYTSTGTVLVNDETYPRQGIMGAVLIRACAGHAVNRLPGAVIVSTPPV